MTPCVVAHGDSARDDDGRCAGCGLTEIPELTITPSAAGTGQWRRDDEETGVAATGLPQRGKAGQGPRRLGRDAPSGPLAGSPVDSQVPAGGPDPGAVTGQLQDIINLVHAALHADGYTLVGVVGDRERGAVWTVTHTDRPDLPAVNPMVIAQPPPAPDWPEH
jgi:hypothetical protein